MNWLDKLERRFGFLGVPGLMRIVVIFTALVFVLARLDPNFVTILDLDAARIRHGEVWRLFTYIFVPQTLSFIWVTFALLFLWFIGDGLERAWGHFRLTLYFVVGMIGTTAAAFFFGSNFSNSMLSAGLFFAFARFYPDEVIYVFFILPLKVKWLAWASAAFLLFAFVVNSTDYRLALIAALSNYLIFFGPEIFNAVRHRRAIAGRRRQFEGGDGRAAPEALHRCATCGATEITKPDLEFRVASNGEEYCMEHLAQARAGVA